MRLDGTFHHATKHSTSTTQHKIELNANEAIDAHNLHHYVFNILPYLGTYDHDPVLKKFSTKLLIHILNQFQEESTSESSLFPQASDANTIADHTEIVSALNREIVNRQNHHQLSEATPPITDYITTIGNHNIKFYQFTAEIDRCGFVWQRKNAGGGSHIFQFQHSIYPDIFLNIQKDGTMAKDYQIRQFLDAIGEINQRLREKRKTQVPGSLEISSIAQTAPNIPPLTTSDSNNPPPTTSQAEEDKQLPPSIETSILAADTDTPKLPAPVPQSEAKSHVFISEFDLLINYISLIEEDNLTHLLVAIDKIIAIEDKTKCYEVAQYFIHRFPSCAYLVANNLRFARRKQEAIFLLLVNFGLIYTEQINVILLLDLIHEFGQKEVLQSKYLPQGWCDILHSQLKHYNSNKLSSIISSISTYIQPCNCTKLILHDYLKILLYYHLSFSTHDYIHKFHLKIAYNILKLYIAIELQLASSHLVIDNKFIENLSKTMLSIATTYDEMRRNSLPMCIDFELAIIINFSSGIGFLAEFNSPQFTLDELINHLPKLIEHFNRLLFIIKDIPEYAASITGQQIVLTALNNLHATGCMLSSTQVMPLTFTPEQFSATSSLYNKDILDLLKSSLIPKTQLDIDNVAHVYASLCILDACYINEIIFLQQAAVPLTAEDRLLKQSLAFATLMLRLKEFLKLLSYLDSTDFNTKYKSHQKRLNTFNYHKSFIVKIVKYRCNLLIYQWLLKLEELKLTEFNSTCDEIAAALKKPLQKLSR